MRILVAGIDSDIGYEIAAVHRELGDEVVTTSRNGKGDHHMEISHPYGWPRFEANAFDKIYYTVGIHDGRSSRMEVMQVNAFATYDFLNSVGSSLKQGGQCVVLSSGWGSIAGVQGQQNVWYRMSKAALNMGVAVLAQRYTHCRWTLMQPGWVLSKINRAGGPQALTPRYSADTLVHAAKNVTEHFAFIDNTGKKMEF